MLDGFGLDGFIRPHIAAVMAGLPELVRDDLMSDPAFVMCDYEPGNLMQVPMRLPRGRAIVLKRTLRHRPEPFVRYVIAHELAHAHLRNRGRWPDDDPEHAADALAAEWGVPRPVMR